MIFDGNNHFFDSILDIFFPPVCISCGKNLTDVETICPACIETIPLNSSLFCGQCGARLPVNEKICHFGFPYILGAATTYKNETVRGLVKELKFGLIKNAKRPLAELLIHYADNTGVMGKDWIVVPVPLGKKRLRERGFNQAELIAEIFAGHFSLPLEKDGFIRRKETTPQSEIKKIGDRAKNTKDCFEVTMPEKFAGRKIILIDDVSTSGSTFFEAAGTLKKSGAKKIIALAVAKG